MRLKTIEIKGFKSFAEKTVINFSEPVIGVVGSNGCGKSNIVDAIRWVLGEQKTSALRSDSMTNVIFNGTKNKPAAGLAEVSLVFENHKNILPSEYNEVAIKRILYKDGTGEYYLNGVRCRLKDIHNLLQNTGVSSDSYAIIALSMVDDLLQDKENARLSLFEQAAGVSGFKGRKKETLNKLKHTDEDLARIEDLLAEIEKNLSSLEKQSARTKKYLQLKNDYKELSIELTRFQVASYKNAYKNTTTQLENEEKKNSKLAQDIALLEGNFAKLKESAQKHEEVLAQQQTQLNSTVGKIKGKESDLKMLEQKTFFLLESQQKMQHQIQDAQSKTLHYQQQQMQGESAITLEQEILEIYKKELADIQAQAQAAQQDTQAQKQALQALQEKANLAQNQRFDTEKQLAITQSKIDQANAQITRLQQLIDQQQGQHRGLIQQMQQADNSLLQYEQQLKVEQEIFEDTQAQIAECTETVEKLREQLAKTTRQHDANQNEFKLLQALVESLEGYGESVKFLNKNTTWSQAQTPLLFSDILSTEAQYRTAIESYLEPYLSYYIVHKVEEAVQAIQLLDHNKKGKANFFILNEMEQNSLSQKIENNNNNNALYALDLLQFEPQYAALLQSLLNNVYLVPTANDIPKNISKDAVYITLDGKLTQKANFLRGGSVAAFEGKKIGRKKDLEILAAAIEKSTVEIQEMQADLKAQQQYLQQLRSVNHQKNIQNLQAQVSQWQRQHAVAKSKLDNFQQQEAQYQDDMARQEQFLKMYKREIDSKQTALQVLALEAQEAQNNYQKEQAKVQEANDKAAQLSSAYNNKNIEVLRQQNKVQTLEKEILFAKQQLEEIHKQLHSNTHSTQDTAQDVEKTAAEIQVLKVEIQEGYNLKKQLQETVEESEKQFFKNRGDVQAMEEEIRNLTRQYQNQLQLINQLQNNFSQTKLQLSTLAERIRIEFELNINDIINEEPKYDTYTQGHLEETVETLRKKLQTFGAVNYMAIEAYEETKTRFDFITAQRKDLLEAKAFLMQTLKEIETAATELFMDAFIKVRSHFITVFRSLFEADDTCDLVLSNPDSPLDSRIEIIAKPKGKKPLSINQLSGGEKTLTATALLFSLYLLKPAPFCIFDEVDAPLDDANVAKFNNIIRDFSKNSQFIIVTHNKKTMETVNIMYGVTMVEGLSRVVPVDFRSYALS